MKVHEIGAILNRLVKQTEITTQQAHYINRLERTLDKLTKEVRKLKGLPEEEPAKAKKDS